MDRSMKKARMIIDILMVVLLPLLMAYSLIGENIHEVLGVCMFVLFIAHHLINWKWWSGIFKGKYNAVRILNTVVNLFLAVFMILQPISGILMSKYVLKEVTISGASSTFRTIHMTLAYWGFMLMSFHLGLHVRSISAKLKSRMNKAVRTVLAVSFLLIAIYGVYAFMKRGIGDYLLMKVMFAFFDFSESRAGFLLDYAAIMVLMAEIAFWIQNGLLIISSGRPKKRNIPMWRNGSLFESSICLIFMGSNICFTVKTSFTNHLCSIIMRCIGKTRRQNILCHYKKYSNGV